MRLVAVAHRSRVDLSAGVVAAVNTLYEGSRMNVQRLRKLTIWPFAISCVLCCWNGCLLIWQAINHNSLAPRLRTLLLLAFFPVLAMIYGTASWSLWQEKPFGRMWGLTAALTLVLIPLWAISRHFRSVHPGIWVMLAAGLASQIILLWPDGGSSRSPKSDGSHGFSRWQKRVGSKE